MDRLSLQQLLSVEEKLALDAAIKDLAALAPATGHTQESSGPH